LGIKAIQQIHELNPQIREKLYFYQLDITSVESIRRFADYIKKKHDGLDILINNAAIAFPVE
jgi:carbonyl reductase 1